MEELLPGVCPCWTMGCRKCEPDLGRDHHTDPLFWLYCPKYEPKEPSIEPKEV